MAKIDEKVFKKNSLVSLEVITSEKLKDVKSQEDLEKFYNSITSELMLVDDLSQPYLLRVAIAEPDSGIVSLEPEYLPEIDQYELMESIQKLLQKNNVPVYKTEFDLENLDERVKAKNESLTTIKKVNDLMKNSITDLAKLAVEKGSLAEAKKELLSKIKETQTDDNPISQMAKAQGLSKVRELFESIEKIEDDGTIIYKDEADEADKK